MNRLEKAQHIVDEFTNYGKKVIKVFFGDPFECCVVFDDFTCTIFTGEFALDIHHASLT